VRFDCCGEEIDGVSDLLASGFQNGQQVFDKTAAGVTLGFEQRFASATTKTWCPGMAERAFASVVGRFQSRLFQEQTELVETLEQVVAQGNGGGV
jgi:hypothetical protein